MQAASFVGIDVGKCWLDVVVLPGGQHQRLANASAGWQRLVDWVGAEPAPLVVLEASGGYEVGVATALAAAGLAVAVGNPMRLRRFAQSQGQQAKTDRVDAAMLAHYAERMRPAPTPQPDQTARTCAGLVTRRRQLTQMRAAERTRCQHPGLAPPVVAQVHAHVAWLDGQIKALDAVLAQTVAADPAWQQRVDQLVTVPGIGVLTATRLVVGLPELGHVSAKAAAALVGVAPYAQDSGQRHGRRTVSGGRRWVRHALYEAVFTTVRWEPTLKAHYAQLRAAGKPHKVAMVACMRRLLGILTAMLRDGLTWSQTAVGQQRFLPPAA